MTSWQRGSTNNNRNQPIGRNLASGPSRNQPSNSSGQTTNADSTTFDKLITYLTKIHKEYSKSDFTEALLAYRQEQQTLAGIPLARIEEDVLSIVRRNNPSKQPEAEIASIEKSTVQEPEQSVAAVLWSTFQRYRAREQQSTASSTVDNSTKEEQCRICLENLSSNKTESFPCQHIFHRNCLEEWFKIERTCPLCRKMLLFNDEFPDLG